MMRSKSEGVNRAREFLLSSPQFRGQRSDTDSLSYVRTLQKGGCLRFGPRSHTGRWGMLFFSLNFMHALTSSNFLCFLTDIFPLKAKKKKVNKCMHSKKEWFHIAVVVSVIFIMHKNVDGLFTATFRSNEPCQTISDDFNKNVWVSSNLKS